MRRLRRFLVPAAIALTVVVTPAAEASVATISGTTLRIVDDVGEANQFQVGVIGALQSVTITDQNFITPPGGLCLPLIAAPIIECLGVTITHVEIVAGDQSDTITIDGPATTNVQGGAGDDLFNGSAGDDFFEGGTGADEYHGGPGNDTIDYSARAAAVTVTMHDDVANDGEGAEADNIFQDVESVTGGSGNDTLSGNGDSNTLTGGAGNDLLNGRGGKDVLTGGDGTDTVSFANSVQGVTADADGLEDDGGPNEKTNVGADVENLTGSPNGDLLVGTAGPNVLSGGAGNDVIDGAGGSDVIDGGEGLDIASYASRTAVVRADLSGDADDGVSGENDRIGVDVEGIIGGSGNDLLVGNSGINVLVGLGGDDVLDGGRGGDALLGGGGQDVVTYQSRSAPIIADIDEQQDDGETGERDRIFTDVEGIVGGSAGDTLTGSDGNNVLAGFGGNDTIDGGKGQDVIGGGLGDDTLLAREDVKDRVACGGGSDKATVDLLDEVDGDCESVDKAAASTPSSRRGPRLGMTPRNLKITRAGVIRLKLSCPETARDGCKGRLSLRSSGKVRTSSKSKTKRYLRLGSAPFSIAKGKTETVRITLTNRNFALIKKRKRLSSRATATTDGVTSGTKRVTLRSIKLRV